MPSWDLEAVFSVPGGRQELGCTGHQEVGLPLGWRDLGWGWQGKRGSLLGAVCLWVEARAEVSSEIRWGVGCLSRRVVWKLL